MEVTRSPVQIQCGEPLLSVRLLLSLSGLGDSRGVRAAQDSRYSRPLGASLQQPR